MPLGTACYFVCLQEIGLDQVGGERMISRQAAQALSWSVVICSAIADIRNIQAVFIEERNRQCAPHLCIVVRIAVVDDLVGLTTPSRRHCSSIGSTAFAIRGSVRLGC